MSLLVWALKWVLQSVTLLLLESPLVCCYSCGLESPSASASGVPSPQRRTLGSRVTLSTPWYRLRTCAGRACLLMTLASYRSGWSAQRRYADRRGGRMRRAAKPHCHFVGTVLCERLTYLVDVAVVASLHPDRISVGACVRRGRDQIAIAVNVDIRRGRPLPGEVNRLHAFS